VCTDDDQIEVAGHPYDCVLRRAFFDHQANGTPHILLGEDADLGGRACATLLAFGFKRLDLIRREVGGRFRWRRMEHGDVGIPGRRQDSRQLQRRRGGLVEVHADQHA
jgi:hypothetical protein